MRALVHAEGVAYEVLDGCAVVLRLADRVVHRLNEPGTAVWLELAHPSTSAQVVTRLSERHGLDRGRLAQDVPPLLRTLQEAGLLVPA